MKATLRFVALVGFLGVLAHAGPTVTNSIPLAANDLAYSAFDQTLYAVVGRTGGVLSNHVVALDPRTGATHWSVALTVEPLRLDVSCDGQVLFVGFAGLNRITEVDIAGRQVKRSYAQGSGLVQRASALEVRRHPTEPSTVAVALGSFDASPIAFQLYRDGMLLTNVSPGILGIPEFSADGTRLFLSHLGRVRSCDLLTDGFRTNGLVQQVSADRLRVLDDRLYLATGVVLDANALTRLGTAPAVFRSGGESAWFDLDPDAGRVYTLDSARGLMAADAVTLRATGSETLRNLTGTFDTKTRLVCLGTNGLAFNSGTRVYFVRPGFQAQPSAADLGVTLPTPAEPIRFDRPDGTTVLLGVGYDLTVSNRGPAAATGAVLTNTLSFLPATNEVTVSVGTWELKAGATNAIVVWRIGELAAGASASAHFRFQVADPLVLPADAWLNATITGTESDSDLTDNLVWEFLRVPRLGLRLALTANDVIPNAAGDRLYVSTPARAGFLGNSVVTVDPDTLRIQDVRLVGGDPDELVLTNTPGQLIVERPNATTNLVQLDLATGQFLSGWTGSALNDKPNSFTDDQTGRSYQLVAGSPPRIVVSDVATGTILAEATLAPLRGALRPLVRWGADGFAFLAPSESPASLIIAEVPELLSVGADTDLRVELGSEQATAKMGEPWTLVARVINGGTVAADRPVLEVDIPSDLLAPASVDPGVTAGTVETSVALVRCRWTGPLEPGEERRALITFGPLAPGAFQVRARAASMSRDPNPTNNQTALNSRTTYVLGANESQIYRLLTADLVPDPTRAVFYASVPSGSANAENQILALDPLTGQVLASIAATNPTALAVSDDGQYLYAAVEGGRGVQRFQLPGLTPDLTFALEEEPPYGPLLAGVLQVVPGQPETVAIARFQPATVPSDRGIGLYVNGALLPATTQDGAAFTFDATGTNLYLTGYYFDHWVTTPEGFTNVSRHEGLHIGANLVLAGNRLFSDSAVLLDITGPRALGTFPVTGSKAPDLANERVYVLAGASEIAAYEWQGFTRVGGTPLPGYVGSPGRLWRWGADGFAFRTDAGQVVFVRSSLVPSGPPAELALDLQIEAAAGVDTNRVVQLRVTNLGPGDAWDLLVEAQASSGIGFVEAVSDSGGSCEIAPSQLRCRQAQLSAGATARFTVRVDASAASRVWCFGGQAFAANPDPDLNTNYKVAFGINAAPEPPVTDHRLGWPAQTMVFDRWHQRLVMSVPGLFGVRGGCLLSIDPVTFQVDAPLVLGPSPNLLALAQDEASLYVSVDARHEVCRLNLDTGRVEATWPLGPAEVASDLQAVPGMPQAMAIALRDTTSVPGNAGGTLVGLPGGATAHSPDVPQVLSAGFNPGQILGYNGSSLCAFTAFGFTIVGAGCGGQVEGVTDIRLAQDRVFTDNGRVFGPDLTLLHQFEVYSYDVVTLPDPASGLIFRLQNGITAYRWSDYTEAGTQPTLGTWPYPSVVRWGASGLAYLSGGQPFVVPSVVGLPADADQDGIPDPWEIDHQLDPQSRSDAAADADADGASNRAEFVAGTDPHDAASVLRLDARPAGAALELSWPTAAGRTYRLQRADMLAGATWTDVDSRTGDGAKASYTVPSAGASGAAYYRVLTALPQ